MMNSILDQLQATIQERSSSSADKSYTKSLLEGGIKKCSQKFAEESAELIIAALSEDDRALIGEAGDVIYHLMVLLQARNITLNDVTGELASRMNVSGHDEKAHRHRS